LMPTESEVVEYAECGRETFWRESRLRRCLILVPVDLKCWK
jgi:hypothetical protein